MNFKIGINQIISGIFIIIALLLLILTVNVSLGSYQKFLAVDESGVNVTGIILQIGNLKNAVAILDKADPNLIVEDKKEEKIDESNESVKIAEMPRIIEIWYEEEVDQDFLAKIKSMFDSEKVDIREEVKEGLDESQVIYKNDYSDLKEELVEMFKDNGDKAKVLKRKDEKEIDISIKIANND